VSLFINKVNEEISSFLIADIGLFSTPST
jgi:hypothetical protein